MAAHFRRYLQRFVIVTFLLLLAAPLAGATSQTSFPPKADDFPLYPEIRPNVTFWTHIFTRYSKAHGVLHDSGDLSRVYSVVDLDPSPTVTAEIKNRNLKEAAIKQHKAILIRLSQGMAPQTETEKKVAALFGEPPDREAMKTAANRLRIQTGLSGQFKDGLIRSGALVPEFKRIFKSYGLPEDLVYLPCVESSFNVHAYSKFGAAGVWQFTRDTGKLFMEIGYVVDERRDPFISSHAAARLLKRNYEELKSWPLAITAYNHGLNGMKRAQKAHGEYPKIFRHYSSPAFQFASRNFYSEFLAASTVAKAYQTHFGDLRLDRPVPHTKIITTGYLSAQDLAQALNVDIDQIRVMNPALRPPVFDGRKNIPKGFELRLPVTVPKERANTALTAHYKDRQKPSLFHRVLSGDTAGSIARLHQVSVNDLILANGLNRRATIYIGQTLRIPVRETAGETVAKAEPAAPAPAAEPVKKEKMPEPAPAQPAAAPDSVPPESVPVVAQTQPAPAPEPAPAPAKPVATEPVAAAPPAPEKTAEPVTETAVAIAPSQAPVDADALPAGLMAVTADLRIQKRSQDNAVGIIRVAAEETLGHYADWLKIPTQRLRILNRLPYGKSISVGQAIRIPLATADRFEEQRYEFHKEILEDFFDSYAVAGSETYAVKPGDNLWRISNSALELPLWLLEKYNPGMISHALKPGQEIRYPQVSPTQAGGTGTM